MIQMPRRSVTRFFIPLIDVLTLLFCIFLLMPMVKAGADSQEEAELDFTSPRLALDEREELTRLREEKKAWIDVQHLQEERNRMAGQLQRLRQENIESLQKRLVLSVLEIGEKGKLFFYDPTRTGNRRLEITADNVEEFIDRQRRQAKDKELYFLILYPRLPQGIPGFPLQVQLQQYERWFRNVAHSYDVPYQAP